MSSDKSSIAKERVNNQLKHVWNERVLWDDRLISLRNRKKCLSYHFVQLFPEHNRKGSHWPGAKREQVRSFLGWSSDINLNFDEWKSFVGWSYEEVLVLPNDSLQLFPVHNRKGLWNAIPRSETQNKVRVVHHYIIERFIKCQCLFYFCNFSIKY